MSCPEKLFKWFSVDFTATVLLPNLSYSLLLEDVFILTVPPSL